MEVAPRYKLLGMVHTVDMIYTVDTIYTQSKKKQKLSGQQDFCRKNFPDKARKSHQFSNS